MFSESELQIPIKFYCRLALCVLLIGLAHIALAQSANTVKGVRLIKNETAQRVDVLIDGKPFTSYLWTDSLMKPILYPIRTASGILITRGFPLEPKAGERADHTHQVGMWFNFGDVNGVDFWNNSNLRTPSEKSKMGVIRHSHVIETEDGKTKGELEVECVWIMPDGKSVLLEHTRFIFYAVKKNQRMIDRITTLTSLDQEVLFRDNKEGLIALRVARPLEQITNVADSYIDANGNLTKKIVNNEGVTGKYLSSEGKMGDDVFGTRGRWASLTGKLENENVTIAILDHPKNQNYPTYWFTRGYGLFSANPFGQKAYSKERNESPLKGESNFKLTPNQSVTFRYRVLIMSGVKATLKEIERKQKEFAKRIK